jgi:hypothetical protein
VQGPAAAGTQQHALQSLTAVLAEMMGAVGPAAAAGSAAAAACGAASSGGGGGGGSGGGASGRGLAQLLISSVAMVEEW